MPIAEIFFGEQDLGNFNFMRAEQSFVGFHQQALANGGAGLFGGHVFQAGGVESEPSAAKTDGTGGNQNDLATACVQGGDGTDNRFNPFQREFTLRASDGGGAQLDDHAPGVAQEAVLGLIAVMKRVAHLLRLKLIDYDICVA